MKQPIFQGCKSCAVLGATIAQWIRLRLPSCNPGFQSHAHHQHFYLVKFCTIFEIVLRKRRK